jgi:Ni/Fe-hydrogenase subunit HybB-like protein
MGSPSVINRDDPRARALFRFCLVLCCAFFIAEMALYLCLHERLAEGSQLRRTLDGRQRLFALGRSNAVVGAAGGLLLHAGLAALMSATLQRTWLRSRSLAVSIVLLIFVAFQGGVVAVAVGNF